MNSLALNDKLYRIVESPSEDVYVNCGKIKEIKSVNENVGKVIEINGKCCIITYPLQYLVNKGEKYVGKFIYSLEVAKNVMVVKEKWRFSEGKLVG